MSPSSPSASSSSASDESETNHELKRKRKSVEDDNLDESGNESSDSGHESAVSGSAQEDVPVLSHAAQRREKKRRKLEEKVAKGDEKDSGKGGKGGGKDRLLKRQNSVWVGNLSFKTTADMLKAFFDGVGDITRVNMPTKPCADRGKGVKVENRGFAYVDFATPDAKVVAIAMSERNLDGRKLLIKDGDDFAGRPTPPGGNLLVSGAPTTPGTGMSKTARKILSGQKQPPAPTLFLGNLGFETTEQSIRELFEAHPPKPKTKEKVDTEGGIADDRNRMQRLVGIRKVRMGTFEDSGACKGFAFVDFMTTESATAALINPRNHQLDGRKLVVEYASADAVRRGGGGPKPTTKDHGTHRKPRDLPGRSERLAPRTYMAKSDLPEDMEGVVGRDVQSFPERTSLRRDEVERSSFRGAGRARGNPGRGRNERPRPGAALALAQREKVAIVPSQGTKLKFT